MYSIYANGNVYDNSVCSLHVGDAKNAICAF